MRIAAPPALALFLSFFLTFFTSAALSQSPRPDDRARGLKNRFEAAQSKKGTLRRVSKILSTGTDGGGDLSGWFPLKGASPVLMEVSVQLSNRILVKTYYAEGDSLAVVEIQSRRFDPSVKVGSSGLKYLSTSRTRYYFLADAVVVQKEKEPGQSLPAAQGAAIRQAVWENYRYWRSALLSAEKEPDVERYLKTGK